MLRYALLALACIAVIGVDPILDRVLPAPPARDPATTPTQDIELLTRFAVGAHALAPSVSVAQFSGQLDADLTPVEEIAALPDRDARITEIAAHLRTAIAAAEIDSGAPDSGAPDALRRVADVRPAIDALDPPDAELSADAAALTTIYTDGPGGLDADARTRLIDRHGYMARVALAWNQPRTDPMRQDIERRGVRAIVAVGVVAILVVVAFVIGCALAIIAIVLRGSDRLHARFRPDRASPPALHDTYVEAVVIFIACLALFKVVIGVVSSVVAGPSVGVRIGVFAGYWLIALATLWPRVRGVSARDHALNIGWIRGRGVFREMMAGIAAYLAFVPVLAVGFVMVVVLSKVLGIRPTHPIVEDIPTATPWELAMLFSLASVWAPLVEESIFRGALYHHLRRFAPGIVSVLITAFLFAAIHPQGITTVPALMALALGFAACRGWRGSLIGSMTTHALHNATLLSLNLMMFG